MCNCTGEKATTMSESKGTKKLISYNSPNTGKHPVRGMATKEFYGYKRRGDQFNVWESDMRVRPDLFVDISTPAPKQPRSMPSHRGRPQELANVLGVRATAEAVQEMPAPPTAIDTVPNEPDPYELPSPLEMAPRESTLNVPLNTLDWGGEVNKGHLKKLAEQDITTLADLIPLTEDNVLAIKGIGAGVTRALFTKLKERNV